MFALKTNAQVFTITDLKSDISETGTFLKIDLNLECKQRLCLDLNLQHESHRMGPFFPFGVE